MKKIRLNVTDLDATEILSRDQLKAIFGGSGSGSGSDGPANISCSQTGSCSGSCRTDGIDGTCMTVNPNNNGTPAGCRCATAGLG